MPRTLFHGIWALLRAFALDLEVFAVRAHYLRKLAAIVFAAVLSGSTAFAAQAPDLSRLIVIGDSLSAGMQNMSLFYGSAYGQPSATGGQTRSYANLVYRQATGRNMLLPAVAEPGFPLPYSACQVGGQIVIVPPPEVDPRSGEQILGSRLMPYLPAQNFAVPGQKLHDLVYLRPSLNFDGLTQEQAGIQILTNLVLGFPTYFFLNQSLSQLEMLEKMPIKPDTLFLWVGSNDALEALRYGDPTRLTPLRDFSKDFSTLMKRVGALGIPHVYVANLPDPTGTAFLVPVAALPAMGINIPLGYPTADGPLSAGDYLTLQALGALPTLPLGTPLPEEFVVTASEYAEIGNRVLDYNVAIREAVDQYNRTRKNAPANLIDAWSRMKSVQQNKVHVTRGEYSLDLNTGLLGGLFSLDGVHPSNTGYAVIANWFIDAINESMPAARKVRSVDVSQVAASDPLVPWNFGLLPSCPAPVTR